MTFDLKVCFIEKVGLEDIELSLASIGLFTYEKSVTSNHEDELEAVGPLETLKIMKMIFMIGESVKEKGG